MEIQIGRRVRYHLPYGDCPEGLVVEVSGTPGQNRDRAAGSMRVLNSGACTFTIITFDGRRFSQIRESSIGRPGIGSIDLLDRVHSLALIEKAHELVAERTARDNLERIRARERFEAAEASRVIEDPPVFFWNGIKDARGGQLQRAYYSTSTSAGYPEGTITVYARDYSRFSEKVRACFVVRNDTDIQTDYFDKDSLRVIPAHPLYPAVKAAADACTARYAARRGAL